MNDNILYRFAKDLSQLYATTRVKGIENCFIRVAQFLDTQVEEWIAKAVSNGYKSSLQKPETLDTLVLLARLKKTYPAGLDASEFVKNFLFDSKLKFFVPVIASFREAANTNDLAILSPYRNILESSRNVSDNNPDSGKISQDLKKLDATFREEIARKVDSAYDDGSSPARKFTKKEKIGNLLQYLSQRFSQEISIAFEETGKIDVVGISDNPVAIRDPISIIQKMFPSYPKENIPGIINDAKIMVKEIIKIAEPQYYNYIYNYIRNKAMKGYAISKDQFNEFKYKSGLKFNMTNDDDTQIDVHPDAWGIGYILIFISMVLYILGTKAQ